MNDQNETVSQTSDTGADTGKLDQGSEDKADSKKKTRKRTGCFTCRRRKKACDERHPVCESCERLDIPCIYPKIAGQVRPRPGTFAKKHREIATGAAARSNQPAQSSRKASSGSSIEEDAETASGNGRIDGSSHEEIGRSLALPDFNAERIPIGGLGPFTIDNCVTGPPPLQPPDQGRKGVMTQSTGSGLYSPYPEQKLSLDPNAHISCASHARTTRPRSPRRFSEDSLAASHHPSTHTDHTGRLDPTLAPGPSSGGILTPMSYMQPTGHMLEHPNVETPIALDQTLVDFIKTMEQSESEWANFILSAGESQHAHGMDRDHDEFAESTHNAMHTGESSQHRGNHEELLVAGQISTENSHRSDMDVDFRPQGHIASHLLAGTSRGAGDSKGQGSIPTHTLSSIASQSHVTSSLAGTSLPSWIWVHVPVLIDYFVNGFGPIISVLGAPSKHSLTQSLLPLAATSPLLLPALIGWSASHLARIGEPYASIARIATEVTDRRVQSLLQAGAASDATQGDVSLEDKLWIVLMLGGIEICKGSVNRWQELLPKIRNLVTLLQKSRPEGRYSDTQISLALNCIYHDVSWSVASKDDPQVPVETYSMFIRQAGSKPDIYLGICAPIYQILSHIAALAARATSVHLVEDSDDRFEQISRVIEEARGLGHRIDLLEVSSRTLSEMAAWQEDEKSFNPQPLISTFQAFKFAAHAYLRQIVYRMPAVSLDAQLSVARMLTTISTVLNTPSQSQILFPLFVAGVDAIREEDRSLVKSIFEKLHTITGTGNIQTIFTLLLNIWKNNDKGNTWVDWRQIASDSEYTISFA